MKFKVYFDSQSSTFHGDLGLVNCVFISVGDNNGKMIKPALCMWATHCGPNQLIVARSFTPDSGGWVFICEDTFLITCWLLGLGWDSLWGQNSE